MDLRLIWNSFSLLQSAAKSPECIGPFFSIWFLVVEIALFNSRKFLQDMLRMIYAIL